MTKQLRLAVLITLILLLTGCSGAFGDYPTTTEAVTDATVVRSLQFIDEGNLGPVYTFSIDIPDEWVGQVQTRNDGNSIYFDYVTENGAAPIFFIEALSVAQFWEQVGSYPGIYDDIQWTRDTYFIYHLPRDAYYSGLSKELYQALSAVVPQVITTFQLQ